jgi:hypothetical protein
MMGGLIVNRTRLLVSTLERVGTFSSPLARCCYLPRSSVGEENYRCPLAVTIML